MRDSFPANRLILTRQWQHSGAFSPVGSLPAIPFRRHNPAGNGRGWGGTDFAGALPVWAATRIYGSGWHSDNGWLGGPTVG